MKIIGCDFHPSFQQIAMVDTETGEYTERTLTPEEARQFYAGLPGPASVITSKAANSYQFKTGQRKWPSRTEIVLPCRLLWWQVGFGAPAPRAALEHVPVV